METRYRVVVIDTLDKRLLYYGIDGALYPSAVYANPFRTLAAAQYVADVYTDDFHYAYPVKIF